MMVFCSIHGMKLLAVQDIKEFRPTDIFGQPESAAFYCRDIRFETSDGVVVTTLHGATREALMLPHELAELAQERAENAATEVRS